jgi:putative FmdB family regulatory protein
MIYEYGCMSCEHTWEEEQRITDEPIKVCRGCGEQTAKRLISSGTNFILKGDRWANTGYSSNSSGNKPDVT